MIGGAADSWLVYMDRLLTLGSECTVEKNCIKEKMLQLVDIYYDALDAEKLGIEVWFLLVMFLRGYAFKPPIPILCAADQFPFYPFIAYDRCIFPVD